MGRITYGQILLRLLASVLIGGIIGLERGMKNRPAGFRTYMLVCMGSCLIMLTNQYLYRLTGTGDPMRLGAQVVSGIGFLGAGTIVLTRRNQIRGLTTAAGLWTAAGVGLALGAGFYPGAVTAGGIVFVIQTLLRRMDERMHRRTRALNVYVEMKGEISFGDFLRRLRELGLRALDVQFEKPAAVEPGVRGFTLSLRSEKPREHRLLLEKLRGIEGVYYLDEL